MEKNPSSPNAPDRPLLQSRLILATIDNYLSQEQYDAALDYINKISTSMLHQPKLHRRVVARQVKVLSKFLKTKEYDKADLLLESIMLGKYNFEFPPKLQKHFIQQKFRLNRMVLSHHLQQKDFSAANLFLETEKAKTIYQLSPVLRRHLNKQTSKFKRAYIQDFIDQGDYHEALTTINRTLQIHYRATQKNPENLFDIAHLTLQKSHCYHAMGQKWLTYLYAGVAYHVDKMNPLLKNEMKIARNRFYQSLENKGTRNYGAMLIQSFEPQPNLADMPENVITTLADYLSVQSLSRLASVSHRLHTLITSQYRLWRKVEEQQFFNDNAYVSFYSGEGKAKGEKLAAQRRISYFFSAKKTPSPLKRIQVRQKNMTAKYKIKNPLRKNNFFWGLVTLLSLATGGYFLYMNSQNFKETKDAKVSKEFVMFYSLLMGFFGGGTVYTIGLYLLNLVIGALEECCFGTSAAAMELYEMHLTDAPNQYSSAQHIIELVNDESNHSHQDQTDEETIYINMSDSVHRSPSPF